VSFWEGKRVLLTGHTGFKGAWLYLWLESLGAQVVALSDGPVSHPSLYELAGVPAEIVADIRDADACARACAGAEIVIHMAAQPLVRLSFLEPTETFDVNVVGTSRLLDAVRADGSARVVIVVTSDKCYRPREGGAPYVEDDPLGGKDPYSASKGAQEIVAQSYAQTLGVPVSTVRAGNVIGGGDWAADRLVPDLFRAALAGQPLVVRAPRAIRPWQHVLNPLSGYLLLAERLWDEPSLQGGWNFGPLGEEPQPVEWVVHRLRSKWPEPLDVQITEDAAGEATWLALDSEKAARELGWAPGWGLEEGLDATVAWYDAYRQDEDMRAFTLGQIAAFAGA
jgi:CDP-glucose 4,6-dehydratase